LNGIERGHQMIRRREFIAGLGGAAAWPLAARAQQRQRMRQIGVLMPYDENEPEGKTYVAAFTQALAGLGWTDGRNVRMDLRWGGADNNRIRAVARELVGLQPEPFNPPERLACRRELGAFSLSLAQVVQAQH
jgi:putative ABC transport system substrate-binding protein